MCGEINLGLVIFQETEVLRESGTSILFICDITSII